MTIRRERAPSARDVVDALRAMGGAARMADLCAACSVDGATVAAHKAIKRAAARGLLVVEPLCPDGRGGMAVYLP